MPDAGPWPASAAFDPAGLTVGGLQVAVLAERFGTPLVVVDAAEVRERMRAVRAAFPRAAYAVKAFTSHAVIRLAWREGLDLLAASAGEIEACLRAGVPAERILFHGNAKTDDDLSFAVASGVGVVIVDGPDELRRLDAAALSAGRVQQILLRVTPEVDVATHEAIATGHAESSFGMALADAPEVARDASAMQGVDLVGFQAHAGSQVLETEPYLQVLDALADVAARAGIEPRVLDIGGGWGVAYDDEEPLAPQALADELRESVAAMAALHGWGSEPLLQVEPGRAIVANAACTVYRVLARKRAGRRDLIAVDGGMSDNLRPMLYDAVHRIAAVAAAGPTTKVTVVGRHCESGDVLARDVDLPASLAPGDLVAVAATGGYTYPLASIYNRFGRPAVVAVDDGHARLWLRREDAADMDRLEVPGRADRDHAAPPESVTIRAARASDAASFAEHWRAVAGETDHLRARRSEDRPSALRRRLRGSDGEATFVAVASDAVIGSLTIVRETEDATRHVATLEMGVATPWRRRGIGAALLEAAFAWAVGAGVRKLLLSVYPSNVAAMALYRGFGFVEEGRLSRHSRTPYGYEDEILMAAWLEDEPSEEDT